jgi:phage-related minor tail protein
VAPVAPARGGQRGAGEGIRPGAADELRARGARQPGVVAGLALGPGTGEGVVAVAAEDLVLEKRLRAEVKDEFEELERGVQLFKTLSKLLGAGSGGVLGVVSDVLADTLAKQVNKKVAAAVAKALKPVSGTLVSVTTFERRIREEVDKALAPATSAVKKFVNEVEDEIDEALDPIRKAALVPVYNALLKPLGTALNKVKDLVSDTVGKTVNRAVKDVRKAVTRIAGKAMKAVGLKKKRKSAPPPPPLCADV